MKQIADMYTGDGTTASISMESAHHRQHSEEEATRKKTEKQFIEFDKL